MVWDKGCVVWDKVVVKCVVWDKGCVVWDKVVVRCVEIRW